jgi:hypothetical protein
VYLPGLEPTGCSYVVKIEQCPATVKLKVKVKVKCFCGDRAVEGEGGICEAEKEQEFNIDCCRCLDPQVKANGVIASASSAESTTWSAADGGKALITPRCGTCNLDNKQCKPENTKCKWSVQRHTDNDTVSISSDATDCGQVTVEHNEGAAYTLHLLLEWECKCGEQVNKCAKFLAWEVSGTKAKRVR